MDRIKNIVKLVMPALENRKEKAVKENPEIILAEVLSKKEARHAAFSYFRNGTLGLKVDSSTWLYYLNLKKTELLAALSQKLPSIKDIRFCIGEIKKE